MTIENPIRLVRQLKGAPISVLWALTIARQPVTEDWLIQVTGYTDKPVRAALGVLVEYGMISRNGRYGGWILAGPELQLPLMNYESEPELFRLDTTTTINNVEGKGLYCDSSSIKESSRIISGSNRKNSGSGKRLLSPYQENVRALLRYYGVGEPKASALAIKNHVTIRAIIGNADYLVRFGKDPIKDIGLFIHRLENDDPVPPTKWEDDANGENHYDELMRYIPSRFESQDDARQYIRDLDVRANSEVIDWHSILEDKE